MTWSQPQIEQNELTKHRFIGNGLCGLVAWTTLCILWSGVLEWSIRVESAKPHKDFDLVTLFWLVHMSYYILWWKEQDYLPLQNLSSLHASTPLENRFDRIKQLQFWLQLANRITYSHLTLSYVLLYFMMKRTKISATLTFDSTPLQFFSLKLLSKTPLHRIYGAALNHKTSNKAVRIHNLRISR